MTDFCRSMFSAGHIPGHMGMLWLWLPNMAARHAEAKFFNEKGPDALKGTPVYDISLQSGQRTVFHGTASEAIGLFPTKVNVTVAASRASVGPEKMDVTMVSTPGFTGDTQRVEIRNRQVHAVVDVYSATSEIAGWSVVRVLRNIVSPIVF